MSQNRRNRLRVVFMGTPEFAVPSLEAVVAAGHDVPLVVSVPDRPRGRGRKMQPSAVKQRAIELGLEVATPERLKEEGFRQRLEEIAPEVICVVAFRILPESIFSIPSCGSFNLHGSLLPAYRGAAPINRAIMAGESVTGVTTFFLKRRVDTGNIIMQRRIPISPEMTAGELHDVMAPIGAEVVVETLERIAAGEAEAQPQSDEEATPAPKIFPEDCRLQWGRATVALHDQIRGLSPYPGAFTSWSGRRLKLLRSRPAELAPERERPEPGTVLLVDGRLLVMTGDGTLEILELQLEGKGVRTATDFLNGHGEIDGARLGD